MRRIAIAGLLLGICCSEPAPVRQSEPVARPPRPSARAWSASILTSGGYSGHGKGYLFFNSAGAASGCSPQGLSPQKRAAIDALVAAARPESWNASYTPAREQMTDQFYYTFNLKLERSDGSGGSYSVAWQDESSGMLPRDLRRLYDALWAAHKECR